MKILMVAGSFDDKNGKPSTVAEKMYEIITAEAVTKDKKSPNASFFINGGNFENDIRPLFEKENSVLNDYDTIFWFANVSNDYDKLRDIKKINPKAMLITSKRNDDDKYLFGELIQRSLAMKANLTVEFSKQKDWKYKLRVFDPLGNIFADTEDIETATKALMDRLFFIKSMTRQKTIQDETENYEIPDERLFVDIVKNYAMQFQNYMPEVPQTERFIGNASFRCSKSMPSFKHDNIIYVSKRNIDKRFITLENFVPVYLNENNDLYYIGNDKPSVDTPVQVRLYAALPRIRYMIHSHCYLAYTPFTKTAIPCGAIEEFDEIMEFINRVCDGDKNRRFYGINLLGHGSLVLAEDLTWFNDQAVKYMSRNLPENLIKKG